MQERLEEPRTEEVLPELPSDAVAEETAAAPAWIGPAWLRMAYAIEFLIALIAVFTVWSQVGGQGHMDLLPWYIKLACSVSLAWCSVRFTAALVEHEKAWNQHTMVWFTGIIIVVVAMGGLPTTTICTKFRTSRTPTTPLLLRPLVCERTTPSG